MKMQKMVPLVLGVFLVGAMLMGCGSSEELPTGDITDESGSSAPGAGSGVGETGGIPGDSDTDTQTIGQTDADYVFANIQYEFDKYRITSGSRGTLTEHGKVLLNNPDWTLRIEGHCDERGTVEYNLSLGEKRADAAKEFLVQYGIDKSRITTISYGKERPLDPSSSEAAWAKNRRGEFRVNR